MRSERIPTFGLYRFVLVLVRPFIIGSTARSVLRVVDLVERSAVKLP